MTAAPPPDDRHLPEPDAGLNATAARAHHRDASTGGQPSDAALALLVDVVAFEAAVMNHAIRRPAPVRLLAAARWRQEREALDLLRMDLRDAACRLPSAQFAPFARPRL